MNGCHEYQELISRLVDGELSRSEYAALKNHMENCADCSAMYAVFASLSDIIGSEDEALPENLHENIMAGVRRAAMVKYNKRRLSKPLRNTLAAAACAALVLFAARGLSPAEKAQDAMLSPAEAAQMDAQHQTVLEAAPAAAGSESTVAASAAASPVPAATVKPTATPVPTEDVYLSVEKETAAPSPANIKNNTKAESNKNNYIVVTVPPTDIPVKTPAPTPVPTPKPTVVPTATPKPTAAPTPTPTVAVEPVQESEAAAPANTEAVESIPAAVATEEAAAVQSEAVPTAAASLEPEATDMPEATDSPSLKERFLAMFSAQPAKNGVTEAAPAAAESLESEQPASAEESPVPEPEIKKEVLIALESPEKLEELEALLDRNDKAYSEFAKLPENVEADRIVSFCLYEPEEEYKDYRLDVHIYGKAIYFVRTAAADDVIECSSPCTLEAFEKFLETLSESEKAPLYPAPELSPSPSPAVTSQPVESPATPENSDDVSPVTSPAVSPEQ